jgi:hypothetical protein
VPLAGDIEDTATNAVDAASRLRRIVEDLDGIVGIELMHAAQAIDLRLRDDLSRSLTLGHGSGTLFKNFRGEVSTWECKPTGGEKISPSPLTIAPLTTKRNCSIKAYPPELRERPAGIPRRVFSCARHAQWPRHQSLMAKGNTHAVYRNRQSFLLLRPPLRPRMPTYRLEPRSCNWRSI